MEIPEHGHQVSGVYLALEACERMGLSPFGRASWDEHGEDERAVLIAYARVRRAEEARERHAAMRLIGAASG